MAAAATLFKVLPNKTLLQGPGNLPYKEIRRVCSYMPKNAIFSTAYKKGYWDGIINLYNNGVFPTGLLDRVSKVLDKHKIPYDVEWLFNWPEPKYDWTLKKDIELRDRHMDAISAVMNGRRGMLQLPTRFGKTTKVAAGSVAGLKVNTLFIAHQLDLIYDAKDIFESFIDGVDEVGVIGDGQTSYKPITVACIDSLASKLKDPIMLKYLKEKVKYVIVDETQYYGPGQYKDVLDLCGAPYRVCMSATAERNDGADLEIEAASGPMLYSLSEKEMIDEGYISDVHVEMIPFDHQLYNEKATGIEYQSFYEMYVVNNQKRNQLIVDEIKKLVTSGHPTISIVRIIEHGKTLKEMLLSQGFRVEFVWGDVEAQLRRKIREDFNNGEYDVLIGSTIFDTAIDLRRASGLVLAAAGSSKIRAPQRVGRVLSYCMDKKAIVKDIKDINIKYFSDDAKDRERVYISRYGKDRVEVRNAVGETDIEKTLGINYNLMFDSLL